MSKGPIYQVSQDIFFIDSLVVYHHFRHLKQHTEFQALSRMLQPLVHFQHQNLHYRTGMGI